MGFSTIDEALNIGVPNYDVLELNLADLTLVCSKNISSAISRERSTIEECRKRVFDFVGNESYNRWFCPISTLVYTTSDDGSSVIDLDKKQKFVNLFSSICEIQRIYDTDRVISSLDRKISDLDVLARYIAQTSYSKDFYDEVKGKFSPIYYGKRKDIQLRGYLQNESKFYKKALKKCNSLDDLNCSDLIRNYLEELDPNKLALFIAYSYLNKLDEYLRCGMNDKVFSSSFYINAFLKLGNKDTSIVFNSSSFSYEDLKLLFDDFKKRCPFDLKDIYYDRSLFLGRSTSENKKLISSIVNLEKIYIDEKFCGRSIGSGVSTGSSSTKRSIKVSEEELAAIKDYLSNKEMVYLRCEPIAKIECRDDFSNYGAYLFPNGKIIADRFYNVNRLSETQSDAAYVFSASTFDRLKSLSKGELVGITPRIIHFDGWEDKVRDVAYSNGTAEDICCAKQLIKRS